jgi:type I restriction enzyme S subunit
MQDKINTETVSLIDNEISLPEGWRLVRLGDVCTIQLGKMLSPASKTGKRSRPYLRNANVQWNYLDLSSIAEMDFSETEEKKFALKYGDLLVCEGGEPGRAAIWEEQFNPCYYQKALHRIRPLNNLIDSKFLMYRLWLGAGNSEFVDTQTKTTIAHLPAVRLAELILALPPTIEGQRRIASVLDAQMKAVEQAREAAETQLKSLDSMVVSILRDSITNGSPRKMKFKDFAVEIKKGVGESWQDFPVLGATRSGLALAKEPVGKKPERYKYVGSGTIFYNPMRILIGSIAMVDEDDEVGITSPDYVVFTGKEGVLHSRWLYYWLRSFYGENLIKSLARGAVRERILFNRLEDAEIDLPDWETQLKAAEQFKLIAKTQKIINEQIKAMKQLPAALLRKAFASEI